MDEYHPINREEYVGLFGQIVLWCLLITATLALWLDSLWPLVAVPAVVYVVVEAFSQLAKTDDQERRSNDLSRSCAGQRASGRRRKLRVAARKNF